MKKSLLEKTTNLKKLIKNNFLILKNIFYLNDKNPKFVFFSENKNYLKYSFLLIEYLSKKFPGDVYYVSSDVNDRVEELNVKNFFVGDGFFLQFFFRNIKTSNLFITLTDLDNSIIKKNKYVKNYIYYFHGSVSTTKVYTEKAFDNYDTILCNGSYHYDEIRLRENYLNLKKKKLVKSGFFYFDYLNIKKKNDNSYCDEILVAPSWNKNKIDYIHEDIEKIIFQLINSKFKVRFRPHPEIVKRSQKLMLYFKKIFKGKYFIYDDSSENFNAMNRAKCLITDNSGISIEFMMIFKKPVIYYDEFDKIHNLNYKIFKNLKTMEDIAKDRFGYKFKKNQINDIENIITNSLNRFDSSRIDNFIDENFYNFNNTINFFSKNLDNICL